MRWSFTKLTIAIGIFGIAYYFLLRFKAGCAYSPPAELNVEGKTVLITGANTGIGLETAKELTALGMRVILACRSVERCANAKEEVEKFVQFKKDKKSTKGEAFVEQLDLSSLTNVRDSAKRIIQTYPQLHILINNAGIMGVPLGYTEDGHEMHFGVNHLGHFLLTELLLPHMKKSGDKEIRIIDVSSEAHAFFASRINLTDPGLTKDYHRFPAYGQSKLANVLHARELARREATKVEQDVKVIAVSLHPGAVSTELTRTWHPILHALASNVAPYITSKTPWEGAQTTLHCALDASVEKHNGQYFRDCFPSGTSEGAQNDEDARDLWALSERLVAPFLT